MTSMFPMPSLDELQLTAEELARLTGSPRQALQVEWLKINGWCHSLTRGGDPVVGRLYANLKLSGVDVATMVSPSAWQPDMSAIQ